MELIVNLTSTKPNYTIYPLLLLWKINVMKKEPQIQLDIDDVSVPMNPFVQKIFTQVLMGMIRSLEGIPEDPECIILSLSKKGKKAEKT